MSEEDHFCKRWRGIHSLTHSFIHSFTRYYEVTATLTGREKSKVGNSLYPLRSHGRERDKLNLVWSGLNVIRTSWATRLYLGDLGKQRRRIHHSLPAKLTERPLCKASSLLSPTACHLIPRAKKKLRFFSPPHIPSPHATWLSKTRLDFKCLSRLLLGSL